MVLTTYCDIMFTLSNINAKKNKNILRIVTFVCCCKNMNKKMNFVFVTNLQQKDMERRRDHRQDWFEKSSPH